MSILLPFIGLSEGVVVGAAIVAFLSILDIIPRLIQISKTYKYIRIYESFISIGSSFFSFVELMQYRLYLSKGISVLILCIIGLFMGIYVGLLASAITEVLGVIPILLRRFAITDYVKYIIFALLCGKVAGSLINWLVPGFANIK